VYSPRGVKAITVGHRCSECCFFILQYFVFSLGTPNAFSSVFSMCIAHIMYGGISDRSWIPGDRAASWIGAMNRNICAWFI
ncbi:hypothetical protein WG66_007623, partial [Moniliophthora roreri]